MGGGAGEAKVCQIAQEILTTGKKQWVTIDLSGATHKPTEGICGVNECMVRKMVGK